MFTALAIITLALGTGATTAIFSVVDSVLLRPLPFPEAGRLVSLCETHPSVDSFCVVSPPNAGDWAARSDAIAAIGQARSWTFKVRLGDVTEAANGALATPSLFSTLGVRPTAGRLFAEDEVGPAARVALLSHSYWQTRFAADRSIVGGTIVIDGVGYEIVGVLPAEAVLPGLERAEVWTPLPFDPREEDRRRWRGFITIGRLHAGVTTDQAAAELNAIQHALAREHPATNEGWGARVVPLLETVTGSVRPILSALSGAALLLLLIACANVASLLVARGAGRQRELAVRTAIGASHGRLVRLVAIETILIAAAGGAIGALAAMWMAELLLAMVPGGLPRIEHVRLDTRVLAGAIGLSTLAGLMTGLAPALRARRVDVLASLRTSGSTPASGSAFGLRRGLLIAEVALAVVLSVGAGLFGRALIEHLAWRPGFEPRGLITLWTFASTDTYKTATAVSALFERIEASLATIPGVTGVGRAANGPLFGGTEPAEFHLAGATGTGPVTADSFDVSPTYFSTLQLPLLGGRTFAAGDRPDAPAVAIVNDAFARRYFSGIDPIGRRLSVAGGREMAIVGVVADVPAFSPGAGTRPAVYWPAAQSPRWATYVVIRTSLPAETVRPAVEARLRDIDSEMVVSNYMTMEARIDRQLARPRFQATLAAAFALAAMALALVGIYGMMAAFVVARRRELGVRLALGASRRGVVAMVLRHAIITTLAGLAIGLTLAGILTRFIAAMLHGVAPNDLTAYATVSALVLAAAMAAALGPARRAASMDPLATLRAE